MEIKLALMLILDDKSAFRLEICYIFFSFGRIQNLIL